MLLVRLLEVLLPIVLVLGGLGAVAWGFVRFLERRAALTGGATDAELLSTMKKAEELVGRIHRLLPERTGEGREVLARELGAIVNQRLPAALERQRRLLEHLGRKSRAGLSQEEREHRRKLASAVDRELKALHERNLTLVQERIEALDRLELASRKADAQIRALLLNLEAFEDRLAASELGKVDGGERRLGELVEDIKLLEAAYDELRLE